MKIGFVALSGVRVADQELMAIGLNLPGFVERSKVIASLPSLGLLTLAGMTPERHQLHYVEVPDVDAEEWRKAPPGPFDVVAISSFTAMIRDAYRLADRYRALGVTVILGGLHVTSCPEEAAVHADALVLGEAEPVWPQLLEDLEQGCLKPRYRAEHAFDLALAPMPRFDLLDPAKCNRITIQTARGCPWNCEFCAASIRLHPSYRTKPVHKVIEELHAVKKIWANPFIEFADDNTFADRRHGHALMDAMRGEQVRWFTETDISVADDPELLAKMRRAGCAQVLIGLEDPGEGVEGVELKANWKGRRRPGYLAAIRRIQEAGITVNGCLVLGLDSQTEESFERLWSFIEESELYEVQLTVMTPFPSTPLQERLRREGRLTEPEAWEKRTLFVVCFQPARMSPEQLRRGLIGLAERVYDADYTKLRRTRFLRQKLLHDLEAG